MLVTQLNHNFEVYLGITKLPHHWVRKRTLVISPFFIPCLRKCAILFPQKSCWAVIRNDKWLEYQLGALNVAKKVYCQIEHLWFLSCWHTTHKMINVEDAQELPFEDELLVVKSSLTCLSSITHLLRHIMQFILATSATYKQPRSTFKFISE